MADRLQDDVTDQPEEDDLRSIGVYARFRPGDGQCDDSIVVRKVYDCFHEDAKHEGECACDGMASCTTPLEVPPGWTVLTQREPSP